MADKSGDAVESAPKIGDLQRQNRCLVEILESIQDGFLALQNDMTVTYFNRRAEELLGRSRELVLGRNLFEVFPEAKGSVFEEKYRLAAREKKSLAFEVHFPTAPYTNWYDVRIFPNPEGISVYFQVTTERHRQEESLRQSLAMFRAIAESVQDAIFSKDMERRYTFVNSTGQRFMGLPASRILGRKPEELFSSAWCEAIREVDERNLRGESVDAVYVLPCQGRDSHLHVLQVPMRDEAGAVCGICGIVRDITDAKNIEARQQQLQKMEAIGQLAGGIAHDFNNILAAILGFSDLGREQDGCCSHREFFDEIWKASRRGKELVKQILTFSRNSQPETQPLQAREIVSEAAKFLRASIPSTVEIRLDLPPDCGLILADPNQIYQVLLNLCSNAVDAMQEKGILEISLADADPPANPGLAVPATPSHVRLGVRDSGAGMDERTQKRIFEPFFTTKETGKGTGLGLAVVDGIVKSHGGAIRVESEPGRGSTFHIFFPHTAQIPRVSEVPAPLFENADPSPSAPSEFSHRILCVDDEESIVKLMQKTLLPLGYKVTATTDGTKALELFHADPAGFDLVILDQTMPCIDGLELSRKMLQKRRDLPVILCSGYSAAISAKALRRAGIREFLMKPVEKRDLLAAIRKVLEKRSAGG